MSKESVELCKKTIEIQNVIHKSFEIINYDTHDFMKDEMFVAERETRITDACRNMIEACTALIAAVENKRQKAV